MNTHSPPLHPFQKEALFHFERSTELHLLVIAGTGQGKSRIFQELVRGDLNCKLLLVSPLVALARQHEENLMALGVPRTRFRVVSPESLTSARCLATIKEWSPNLLVIDECHCIWEWGEGFRPSFLKLPHLVRTLAIRKSLWLTATLPRAARRELHSLLQAQGVTLKEMGSFRFPTQLTLQVHAIGGQQRLQALIELSRHLQGPGILFAWTRQNAERLSQLFAAAGIQSASYHAGYSKEERQALEGLLRTGKIKVMTATSAFGMGMDFQALRWVVIAGAPPSLLSLAQALGRVGRQGKDGRAFVLWREEDFQPWVFMSGQSTRKIQAIRETLQFLQDPRGDRIRVLEKYFNEEGLPEPSNSLTSNPPPTGFAPGLRAERTVNKLLRSP